MNEPPQFGGSADQAVGKVVLGEPDVSRFLQQVGDTVRMVRGNLGISRRELAEKTGISQRYLAQLEAGQGNISIGLLLRVADALGCGIERLVAGGDPWSPELTKALYLLKSAPQVQRDRAIQMLEAAPIGQGKANRIALIGLRGAGKSTLGKLVAGDLGVPFMELNDHIEQNCGMPVDEVIALYGQEGYRLLEYQAAKRVAATQDRFVLAVAGGIVSQPDTFDYLLDHYHTVWLRAAPEEHMHRVRAQGDMRPMAERPDAMEELRDILQGREQQYSRADAKLDTQGKSVEQSQKDLIRLIAIHGFMNRPDGGT